jgi:arginine deiminase
MEPIQLSVFSEIGQLKQVVVHDPGPEVDLMVPQMMEELLFDDILFGDMARREHRLFRHALGRVADEVLDIQDLFMEALEQDGAKLGFIEDLRRLVNLPDQTCNLLRDMSAREVARSTITGISWDDARLATHWQKEFDYRIRPVPNLLFMRDPAAVLGHGYNINFMATWAREREPLILSYVFRHHPRLRHVSERARFYDQVTPLLNGDIKMPQSLEGGDTLVLSDKVIAVGCSERTSADAINLLAENLRSAFHQGESPFEHLLMVLMPKIRSAMHLDTIFTRTSHDECLIYPPYFTDGNRELLNVVVMDLRHEELRIHTAPNLLRVMKEIGIDLKPIFCGGADYIMQQREQWTDGANAFCLAPGVIVMYARNRVTAGELDKAGYQILTAGELIADPSIDLLDGKKHAIMLESSELTRARGGPRCMTMPLARIGCNS